MKKKLIASFIMASVIFTNMPQDLWTVRAAGKTMPDNGKADITEFINVPETIDAIAQIEELYEDINLKNAEKKAFGTKTLIIKTGVQAFDTFGAAQCICIGDYNYVTRMQKAPEMRIRDTAAQIGLISWNRTASWSWRMQEVRKKNL